MALLRQKSNKNILETANVIFSSPAAPSSPHSPADDPPERGFFIRMKSTLTKRGLHVKSSGYKVWEEMRHHNLRTYYAFLSLLACVQNKITIWVCVAGVSHTRTRWSLPVYFMAVTLFRSEPLHVSQFTALTANMSKFIAYW